MNESYESGDAMRYRKLKDSPSSRARSKIVRTFAPDGISRLKSYIVAKSKPFATPLVKKLI